ncbi:molybdate ABC transporter substrate-binding protein [Butyricicoccus sp.]|uniref:molybdate ABC transporter substrate-binding protein n=1 Tax=Butyricicoccus sp. TaxID=2049021 RepID=UPI003F17B680
MKMKKWTAAIVAAVLSVSMLAGCGSSSSGTATDAGSAGSADDAAKTSSLSGEVTVFAAKSMTDCLDELIADYNEENPDVEITANYAGSGDLQSQIENGAPCDLFLSAAQKQMDALCDEDLMAEDTRSDLLTNEAVLVVPKDSDAVASFEDLASDSVKKVAIGNPDSVPVGQYAQEILTTLGIWETVNAKAVLGSDVRQVLAWCETGEVDAGIVYATDAAVTDSVKVVCAAPEDSCAPVIYPIALTRDGAENEAAQSFLEFLKTDDAAEVFEAYGFGMAE